MNERELIQLFGKSWMKIIISQLAPTALLITTIALLQFGLAEAKFPVRIAAALILLASGVLGALAQYASANEAVEIAKTLKKEFGNSLVAKQIHNHSKWLFVVKFVTPAIFTAIFVAILIALFF